MKPHECQNETRVIEAARTSRWDPDLRKHVAHCQSCANVALAARALNEMRALDEAEARIPDAGLMWWKAQLLAKQRAGERATQPISFAERFAYAWAAICAIGVCIWQWDAIREWVTSVASHASRSDSLSAGSFWHSVARAFWSAVPTWSITSAYIQGPGLVVLTSLGILLIFVVFAAYFSFSEE